MRKVEVARHFYLGNDGKSYTVVEWATQVSERLISGSSPSALGTSEFLLSDGSHLYEQAEDLVFEIARTGVIIRPA